MRNIKGNINKFIDKYNVLSAPLKASMWFLFCSIVQKGFAMISTPIFTRVMSAEQYGKVANFSSWYDLIYPFATMYITGVAYNNVLVKHEEEREKATFSLMTLTSSITLCFFLVYCVGSAFFNQWFEIETSMMYVMFLELLFIPIVDFWSAKERYDYRYKKLIAVTLMSTVFSMILGLIGVLISNHKYEARVTAKALVTVIIGLFLYYSIYKKAKGQIDIKYWKYALRISVPLIPHYLSIKILNQVDRVMITKMEDASSTGLYSLAYTVASLMIIVTDAINRSMCPFVYKGIKNNELKPIRRMTSAVVLLVLMVTILEMLVAPELIYVFATKEYMDAIWIIPPVALSIYFTFLYVVFSNVEFYFEKTIFATVVSVVVALFNIVLNYIFIGRFGYYAAGFTTLVCYILFVFLHYINFRRVIKSHQELKDIYNVKFLFLISIVGIVIMLICLYLYNYRILRWSFVVAILIMGFIYRKNIIKVIKMNI